MTNSTTKVYDEALQERVRKYMKDTGLSQNKLAPRIGMSGASLSNYMNCKMDGSVEGIESRLREFLQQESEAAAVQVQVAPYKLDETYKARFARFSFRVWPNAYCDELEVWGTKKVDGSSVPLSASGIEPRPLDAGGYAERDTALGGANDIVLVPNYSAADEREGRADAGYQLAEILPYAAYLDREGGIVDTMFDGFLFCPTGTGLDGGHFYDDASLAEIRDMHEKTFAAGPDVPPLDEAVGLTKPALVNREFKTTH